MTETVTIPRAEYERLLALEEDCEDFRAALAVGARIADGAEELVPAAIADRLIDGEAPLRVWRQHRGLSRSALARVSGVNRVQIVEIEAGRKAGSLRTLRNPAGALGVALDDIAPA